MSSFSTALSWENSLHRDLLAFTRNYLYSQLSDERFKTAPSLETQDKIVSCITFLSDKMISNSVQFPTDKKIRKAFDECLLESLKIMAQAMIRFREKRPQHYVTADRVIDYSSEYDCKTYHAAEVSYLNGIRDGIESRREIALLECWARDPHSILIRDLPPIGDLASLDLPSGEFGKRSYSPVLSADRY